MIKKIIISAVSIFMLFATNVAFAVKSDTSTYTIEIPASIRIEGIGVVSNSQSHGIPTQDKVEFARLVENTYDGDSWQLTTDKPIGISVTYSKSGYITAKFELLVNENGYKLTNISVFPARVVFDTRSGVNNVERIFQFHPIVKVTKNTPPGRYTGKIIFTVIELP